jgi:hypothetical protein
MAYTPPPPTSMKMQRGFSTDIPEETARARLGEYFARAGYQNSGEGPRLEFARGSAALTQLSFGPRGWHAKATGGFARESGRLQIEIVYTINTTGQLVTGDEEWFFLVELEEIERAVNHGELRPVKSRRAAARVAFWKNVFVALLLLALTAGGGGGGIWLGERRDSRVQMALFGLVGGIGALVLGIVGAQAFIFRPRQTTSETP